VAEDVDLTCNIRPIAPDLVAGVGEALPKFRGGEKRWSSEVRRWLPERVVGTAQPVIVSALAVDGLAATVGLGMEITIGARCGLARRAPDQAAAGHLAAVGRYSASVE
jgi:hypothetical protein